MTIKSLATFRMARLKARTSSIFLDSLVAGMMFLSLLLDISDECT